MKASLMVVQRRQSGARDFDSGESGRREDNRAYLTIFATLIAECAPGSVQIRYSESKVN